jgi:hypothetical protein
MPDDIDLQAEPAASATWSVPREWAGDTAFLIGGGPSLRGFPVDRLRGRGRVIVINRMVLPCEEWPGVPWADVLHFCDCSFWVSFRDQILPLWQGGRITTLCNGYMVEAGAVVAARMYPGDGLLRLARAPRLGLSNDPRRLSHGSSSGYQAINLAYLFGATRIVLLGFDLQFAGDRTHTHAGYGIRQATLSHQLGVHASAFPFLVEPLERAGVEVLNASPNSALTCWPRIPRDETLSL